MSLLLPTRRMLLLGGDGYLLREEWNGSSVSPGRWTKTDTESKITIGNGLLSFSGGKASPAWADPAVDSVRSFTRRGGLTLEFEVTPAAANAAFAGGFSSSGAAVAAWKHPVWFRSDASVAIDGNGTLVAYTYAGTTSYRVRLVLKATGALTYISDDAGATWKLVWDERTDTTASLDVFLTSYAAVLTSSFMRVYQGTVKSPVLEALFASAFVCDTGQAFTQHAGTFGVTGGAAYTTTETSGDRATADTGILDGIFEVDSLSQDWVAANGQLIFRGIDTDDFLTMAGVGGAQNTVYLYKWDAGTPTELSTAAQTFTNGQSYNLKGVCIGNFIKVYVNNVEKISYTLAGADATKFNGATATRIGFRVVGTGADAGAVRLDGLRAQGGLP